ncbi:MAG: hypothetical protein KBD21_03820, partial [Candidatus Pacebacteria bacterium]|nr:hypothetical protein [Candidatus Paceibacterota bacterium]
MHRDTPKHRRMQKETIEHAIKYLAFFGAGSICIALVVTIMHFTKSPPTVQTDSTRLVVATTTKDESLPDTPSVSVDTTIPPSIVEQGVVRPPASETPVVASPPPPTLGTLTPARRT